MLSTAARYTATCAACKQAINPGNAIAKGQFHDAWIHQSCHDRAWKAYRVSVEGSAAIDAKRAHDLESTPPLTPPPGSYAATARAMAGLNPPNEDGEFWDNWKDEMKEGAV